MHALRWISTIIAVDGLGLALLTVNERGRTRFASLLLVLGLLVIITVSAATGGGIHAPAATQHLTVVFIAGLLLGERHGHGDSAGVQSLQPRTGGDGKSRAGCRPSPSVTMKSHSGWEQR